MSTTAPLWRACLAHPLGKLLVAATLASLALGIASPDLVDRLAQQREGWLEDISHLVLAGACLVWIAAVARAEGIGARLLCLCMAAYLVLLFFEEIDWGRVYDMDLGWRWFMETTGYPSLHASRGRPATMFHDRMNWFVLPAVAWAVAGLLPALRRAGGAAAALPTRVEAALFLAVLGSSFLMDLVLRSLHNVYQVLAYAVLAAAGLRVLRR